jgi:uncharacterized membrane protein
MSAFAVGRCRWRTAAVFLLPAGLVGLILVIAAPGDARAHGKQPDLDRYCQQKYESRGIVRDKWEARWGAREKRWVCYKPGYMGFNAPVPPTTKPLDLSEACRIQLHVSAIHYHEAAAGKKPDLVLCGPAERTAAAPSAPPPAAVEPEPRSQPEPDTQTATRSETGAPTQTLLRLCNGANSPRLDAAFVFWDSETPGRAPGWTSVGWHSMFPGRCKEVPLVGNSANNTYLGYVYIFGIDHTAQWGGNDGAFCIDNANAFSMPDSDKAACNGYAHKRVGMSRLHIKPGVNTWTFYAAPSPR